MAEDLLAGVDVSSISLIVDRESMAKTMHGDLGTVFAIQSGIPIVIAPIMGIIAASFGGYPVWFHAVVPYPHQNCSRRQNQVHLLEK